MDNEYLMEDAKKGGAVSTVIEKVTWLEKWVRDHQAVKHKPIPLAARVFKNANMSIANAGTGTAITFNTVIRDDGGFFTVANPTRLTAPVDGWYYIVGNAIWAGNATGIRQLTIYFNNSTSIAIVGMPANATAGAQVQNLSTVYYMTAGQYVELYGYQNSGGALNISTVASYSPIFAIHLVK